MVSRRSRARRWKVALLSDTDAELIAVRYSSAVHVATQSKVAIKVSDDVALGLNQADFFSHSQKITPFDHSSVFILPLPVMHSS